MTDLISINPKALDLPVGTSAYEKHRFELRKELSDKIPRERWLKEDVISKLPNDVTGIPRACGLLTEKELQITEQYDAPALVKELASGSLTSVEVTTAFCKRAAIAHQLTGCLVDYFEGEALQMAKKADKYLQETGKTLGPLHGLPISVKDHMPIENRPTSTGFISTREAKSEEDCLLVDILRKAGAVFYVKTNQPQGIMHLEADSFFYRSLNPYNTDLTCGGSTGGEGALIGMRGSVLGLGTDIGGSIRGPSAFCGIWGYKPSSQIVPLTGMPVGILSAPIMINCAAGPMTVSLAGIQMFMKVVCDAKPETQDSQLTRWLWPSKIELPQKKIRIGIVKNDGLIIPQPPVAKALKWAEEKLSKAGQAIELVPYTPYNVEEGMKILLSIYYPTGSAPFDKVLKDGGEPMHILSHLVLEGAGEKAKDAFEICVLKEKMHEYRMKFVEHYNTFNLDAVLSPAFVGPAPVHDTATTLSYTAIWNLMDWPGLIFPTPIRANSNDAYEDEAAAKQLSSDSAKVVDLWKSGKFDNAPVNLQLLSRRYYDNELNAIMNLVENVLQDGK